MYKNCDNNGGRITVEHARADGKDQNSINRYDSSPGEDLCNYATYAVGHDRDNGTRVCKTVHE